MRICCLHATGTLCTLYIPQHLIRVYTDHQTNFKPRERQENDPTPGPMSNDLDPDQPSVFRV